jgi:hypothetical protein
LAVVLQLSGNARRRIFGSFDPDQAVAHPDTDTALEISERLLLALMDIFDFGTLLRSIADSEGGDAVRRSGGWSREHIAGG